MITPANPAERRPPALQGSDLLDPELRIFATRPCGSLEDVAIPRRETADFLRGRTPLAADGVEIENHTIRGAGDTELTLRLYRPRPTSRLPVLLYFHGGAFVLGTPELDDPLCIRYAGMARCAVVSVGYRLAPEHPFPSALEDGHAALAWAGTQGPALGLDPDRIAVGGTSAGGALAAGLTLLARDRAEHQLALQMLIYPVLDDRLTTKSMTEFTATPVFARNAAAEMWGHYLGGSEASAYAAPARAESLAGLPPAYLEAAAIDPLRDEAIDYARRLRDAGVATELHLVAGAPHGFDQDYLGAPPASQIAERAMASRAAALRSIFHPP